MPKVYLMNMLGTDFYKIGYTARPISKRLSEVQVGCPTQVIVEDTYESDNAQKIECAMHNKFKAYKSSGEWFELPRREARKFVRSCELFEKAMSELRNSENPFV